MIRTTIKHGYLNVEFCEDGSLQITSEQSGQSMRLSRTEWIYIQKVAELHGWPIVPNSDLSTVVPDAPADF